MKKLAILASAVMTMSCINAQKIQEKDIPAKVNTSLQKSYPTAKGVKWEKENANYEAEFEVGKTEYSLLLDASGSILETEIEIGTDALPANVKAYVSKNYPEQKIKEAAKITDAKGTVTYEAGVKGKDLIFDSKGNFIKEEIE